MGVPAFFRWLTQRAPQVTQSAIYSEEEEFYNPHIDNLYLDLNGIIHPCTHPQTDQGVPKPQSESDMWISIKRYLDLVIGLTRPKKLIYFAIDGVAPKAKMNQQRGRRFRAAQEITEGQKQKQKLIDKLRNMDVEVKSEVKKHWDHNVITPGTIFMEKVSDIIKAYICDNLTNNELWKDLNIIFSDSNVPREGEHKILEFIRKQRSQPDYNPNLSHCIYGADADLIMLGLSTHEPNFYIIRENIDFEKKKKKDEEIESFNFHNYVVKFVFIKIIIVREYIDDFMKNAKFPFGRNLENILDDFVLLCFIVGNDFLPNIPGFNIRQGGIDILLNFYERNIQYLDGYLTDKCEVNLHNLEQFFKELSLYEYDLLSTIEEEMYRSWKSGQERDKMELNRVRYDIGSIEKKKKKENQDVKLEKKEPNPEKQPDQDGDLIIEETFKKMKLQEKMKNNQEVELFCQYGKNYKQQYYRSKFGVKEQDYLQFIDNIKDYYIQGIVWNYKYYYDGCCSWSWFYPYYYSPFLSDLNNFSDKNYSFQLSKPIEPFKQLMSVLPPFSAHALPDPLAQLMLDENSIINDFYPLDFHVDLKGKTMAWLGEVILPFIDDKRMTDAINGVIDQVEQVDLRRNELGESLLIRNKDNSTYSPFGQSEQISNEIYHRIKDVELASMQQVLIYKFKNPESEKHLCEILPNCQLPQKSFNVTGRIFKNDLKLINLITQKKRSGNYFYY